VETVNREMAKKYIINGKCNLIIDENIKNDIFKNRS
jgi:hypothetical protein